MKRFITYLYECANGTRQKNVGFLQVDCKGERMLLRVCIRKYACDLERGELLFYFWEDGLKAVCLHDRKASVSQMDSCFELDPRNVAESGRHMDAIEGVGLHWPDGTYLATCWKDAHEEEIIRGEFCMLGEEDEKKEKVRTEENDKIDKEDIIDENDKTEENQLKIAEAVEGVGAVENPESIKKTAHASELTSTSEIPSNMSQYRKLDLSEIRTLPSPNWYLCNNPFLVHGFINYHYLVLRKTKNEEGETKSYLGVPGIFELPEKVMAAYLGFTDFSPLATEVEQAGMGQEVWAKEKKKSGQGTFGCWWIEVKEG